MRLDTLLLIIASIFAVLPGCNTDTTTTDLEQDMFLKNTPPAKYVISSPLEGILLKDGKPLSHAKIIRKLRWNGNEEGVFQEFSTDQAGAFSLPAHEEELSIGPLVQFVGKTNIEVEHEGVLEHFWFSSKTVKDLNSEYDEPPWGLVCDIGDPDIGVNIKFGTCLTRCRWSNMPKEDDPNEL